MCKEAAVEEEKVTLEDGTFLWLSPEKHNHQLHSAPCITFSCSGCSYGFVILLKMVIQTSSNNSNLIHFPLR